MSLHVGFTGTQSGMTYRQDMAVYGLVLELGASDVHHGDCIGADDQMDQIGRELGLVRYIHPPSNPSKRAWCSQRPGMTWEEYPPQPYLTRNKAIVESSKAMIAAPREMQEVLRSGTWSTIRHARGIRPIYVVWPDGTVGRQ